MKALLIIVALIAMMGLADRNTTKPAIHEAEMVRDQIGQVVTKGQMRDYCQHVGLQPKFFEDGSASCDHRETAEQVCAASKKVIDGNLERRCAELLGKEY